MFFFFWKFRATALVVMQEPVSDCYNSFGRLIILSLFAAHFTDLSYSAYVQRYLFALKGSRCLHKYNLFLLLCVNSHVCIIHSSHKLLRIKKMEIANLISSQSIVRKLRQKARMPEILRNKSRNHTFKNPAQIFNVPIFPL